jgi:hypothetical protein
LLVACLVFSVPWACAVGPEEASGAVADADRSLRDAFRVVSDAETFGAKVSGLMGRLNEAGVALTSAEVALSAGNYSGAVGWAGSCKALADGISGDAGVLKSDSAARAAGWWLTVSFSVVGAAVFVAALLLVWRWFRRTYEGKLLESRPEVAA